MRYIKNKNKKVKNRKTQINSKLKKILPLILIYYFLKILFLEIRNSLEVPYIRKEPYLIWLAEDRPESQQMSQGSSSWIFLTLFRKIVSISEFRTVIIPFFPCAWGVEITSIVVADQSDPPPVAVCSSDDDRIIILTPRDQYNLVF